MNYDVRIIRSGRKSISLEIVGERCVLVRAPYRMAEREIIGFVSEKKEWIEKHLLLWKAHQAEYENCLGKSAISGEEVCLLAKEAKEVIPERIAYYAPMIGVTYGRITIRHQRSRWGSCSAKGNLNFNCLLMKAPPEVLDYVVVHELCHRKEMNHSKRFWAEVERVLPDYQKARQWLKEKGSIMIERME